MKVRPNEGLPEFSTVERKIMVDDKDHSRVNRVGLCLQQKYGEPVEPYPQGKNHLK